MSTAKSLLQKIFISHSSLDKRFVRKLAKRVEKAGFQVWLDEHELIAGDPLGESIADGLSQAKIVLVIVSGNSVKSKWLRYELNLATERMVKGDCRVIPVVIDDTHLPSEVIGLLYADFKSSFSSGMKSILTALEYEARKAASSRGFWAEIKDVIENVFGSYGYGSSMGEYQSRDYSLVFVPVPNGPLNDTSVVYEVVPANTAPARPLSEQWWDEYQSSIEEISESLFLVVTERPIAFEVQHPEGYRGEIGCWSLTIGALGKPYAYIVVADVSRLATRDERAEIIKETKRLLTELAQSLAARNK